MYLKKTGFMWIRFNWLRTGSSGRLSWTRRRTFGFYKLLEQPSDCQLLKKGSVPQVTAWDPYTRLRSNRCQRRI